MKRPALVGAALVAACSTAAPEEQDRSCTIDADCLMGQICSNDFCYDNVLQPRGGIALDVRTEGLSVSPFRVELLGDDRVFLDRIVDRLPYRYYIDRADVRNLLRITLHERQYSDIEAGKSEDVTPAASIELQQPSRLARTPFVVTDLSYPPPDPDMMSAPQTELVKAWPHYNFLDALSDQPLYAKLTYQDDGEDVEPFKWGRGIVARQLMRVRTETPEDDTFDIKTVRECHRRLLGNIRFPDGPLATEPPLIPAPTIGVDMRHAGRVDDGDPETPVCDPAPLGETPATCSVETIVNPVDLGCTNTNQCPDPYECYADPVDDVKRCGCKRDSECPKGQVCRVDKQQCALDLTDRPAIKLVTVDPLDDAPVSAWVYTYCDEDPTADRTMEFVVSATPDVQLGLPRLNYRVVLTFLVGDLMGTTPLGRLCLPTWERAHTVLVPLRGEPALLYTSPEDEKWVCCDTSCLIGSETDPPPAPEKECDDIKANIAVVGNFSVPDPATWAAAACMPLSGADEQGNVRATYGAGDCPLASSDCTVNLSSGPPGGNGQAYTLRIEPPVGSLFRSKSVDVTITSDLTAIAEEDLKLQPRVLLRGQVLQKDCKAFDCVPTAEVLAERVIRGEDPTTLLGPYYYSTTTRLGEYVLPVNPGVYLVTALPTVTTKNSDTGPAPIVVVDLREGSKHLVKEGDVWVANMDELVLSPGAVYTVELDDFVSNSRVIPLDLTTWAGLVDPADPDGLPLDLNAPGTCQPSEGCQIRRLRSGNSPVRVPQDQIIRFVARAAAAAAE